LSQTTPRCFIRLYLPQRHSQSVMGPKIFAQKSPSRSGLKVPELIVSRLEISPKDHDRIFSGDAREILIALKSFNVVGRFAKASVSTIRSIEWVARRDPTSARGRGSPAHGEKAAVRGY